MKAGESGEASAQAVWGTRGMERRRVQENTCGEGASDVPVMGNYWATGRKWAAVGVGFLPFGENHIKWSCKHPRVLSVLEKCKSRVLSEYLTLSKRVSTK